MTKEEFKKLNEEHDLPWESFGDALGYKCSTPWEEIDNEDIIFIPANAYEVNDVGFSLCYIKNDDDAYSKKRFIEICDGNEENAKKLFEDIEWDYPEDAYDNLVHDSQISISISAAASMKNELFIGIKYLDDNYDCKTTTCHIQNLASVMERLFENDCEITETYFANELGQAILL